MKKIKTYNITYGLPLFIVVIFVVLFIFQAWHSYHQRVERINARGYADLQATVWQLTRLIEYDLTSGNIERVQQELANFSLRKNAEFSALLNDDNTIFLASHFSWKGLDADTAIPGLNALHQGQENELHYHIEQNDITAFAPIVNNSGTQKQIRSQSRKTLVLRINLERELDQALTLSLQEAQPVLAAILFMGLLLIWVIKGMVLTPWRALETLAEQLREQRFNLKNPLMGNTTQAQVGQALVDSGNHIYAQLTELKDRQQRLDVTLQSIGDAVIVTDPQGHITRMNPKACELTGWTQDEAIGQALPIVFDIYDASTNNKVHNPVEQVLATQSVVELANHTVLVSRTGQRSYISDSAAPIRDSGDDSATILGVILVFQDVSQQHRLREQLQRNQQDLLEEKSLLRSIIDSTPDLIFVKDSQGSYLRCNRAYEEFIGLSEENIINKTDFDFVDAETAELFREYDKTMMGSGNSQVSENTATYPDGREVWLETLKAPFKNEDGEVIGVVGVSRNVTKQRQDAQDLHIAGKVFDSSNEGILVTDAENNIIHANPALCEMSGYSMKELLGKNPRVLGAGLHDIAFYQALWEELNANGSWVGEIWNHRKNGDNYPQRMSISTIKDKRSNVQQYIAIMTDISESKKAQDRIAFLAQHDVLTGLPNRSLLNDRIQQAIHSCERNQQKTALLFLDLDRFKFVNDSMGHTVGDKLLLEVAKRLTNHVREGDTVSRTGGDEFTVLLINADEAGAANVAQNLIDSIAQPFEIEGQMLFVTLSIGISVYPDNGMDSQTLNQRADTAMYRAKHNGRNQYQFFTEDMHTEMLYKVDLENDLRTALDKDEFELVYQPQIDINTTNIIGCEALIRWHHPEKGYISPIDFIPIAEETGLINPIGDWVLDTAAKQLPSFLKGGNPEFIMAVNLSGVQFSNVELVANIQQVLKQYDIQTHNFEVEITESIAMKDIELTTTQLQALSDAGLLISLDDFGTGYSSLGYLKKFPINKLKIDQSFVRDMLNDSDDDAIVDAVITLAQSLGLETIAEGVETKAQRDALQMKGCDQMQGYYFSKPISAEQFIMLLASHNAI